MIKDRESTLGWSDCEYVHRKMSEVQQRVMKYACGGFKKTGLNDDLMVIVSMMELRELLNKLIEKSYEKNGKKRCLPTREELLEEVAKHFDTPSYKFGEMPPDHRQVWLNTDISAEIRSLKDRPSD